MSDARNPEAKKSVRRGGKPAGKAFDKGADRGKGTRKSDDPGIPALALRERLERAEPGPCYILLGDESYLQDEALAALRERAGRADPAAASPAPREAAVTEFEGARAELAAVLDELRTLPFLGGGHRLVVVRDAGGQEGFATRHAEALATFLAAPPDTGTLVLVCDRLDRRTKVVQALVARARLVSCEALDPVGLRLFLRQRAAACGAAFATGADRALLERLGGKDVSLAALDSEVRKLAAGGGGTIGRPQIEALASEGSSEDSFSLVDTIARGDLHEALLRLEAIFRDGLVMRGERNQDPTGVAFLLLGMLRWDLGRLLRARALLDRGVSRDEVARELKLWGEKKSLTFARLGRADRHALGRRHEVLREADLALKTGGDPRTVLTAAVVRLARAEQARGRRRAV